MRNKLPKTLTFTSIFGAIIASSSFSSEKLLAGWNGANFGMTPQEVNSVLTGKYFIESTTEKDEVLAPKWFSPFEIKSLEIEGLIFRVDFIFKRKDNGLDWISLNHSYPTEKSKTVAIPSSERKKCEKVGNDLSQKYGTPSVDKPITRTMYTKNPFTGSLLSPKDQWGSVAGSKTFIFDHGAEIQWEYGEDWDRDFTQASGAACSVTYFHHVGHDLLEPNSEKDKL